VELSWLLVVTIIGSIFGMIKALIPAALLPKKNVKGQTVLVTGAGSGLGRLMAIRFAKLGCNLVLWDINEEGNKETAQQVKTHGVSVHTYKVDLSSRDDIYKVADETKKDVKMVDILINNAGIVTGRKFLQCPDNMIQKTMDVNIMAHFWTVKAFLPAMMKINKGHIISIASAAGFSGVTGLCDYCASKFAAVGFDESLRNELQSLGKDGVNTTVICPYYINTGMFEGVVTKFPFILPILEQDYVVDKIMEAILTNQSVLMLPRILYFVTAIKSMVPSSLYTYIANVTGVNNTMDMFVGRAKNN